MFHPMDAIADPALLFRVGEGTKSIQGLVGMGQGVMVLN